MSYKSTILVVLLCAFALTTVAQQTDPNAGNYDAHAAFSPLFILKMEMNTDQQVVIRGQNTGRIMPIILLLQIWMKEIIK
ncbi:hypothetical protein [Pedobacter panaciterrae]